MHIAYWIFYGIATLLFGAVLELNKNTIIGWILLVILAVIFPVLYMTKLSNGRWFVKLIAWLAYFALFFGILLATWPPVKAVPASDDPKPEQTGTIMTEDGLVRGVYSKDHTVEIYTGIPYAKAPVGDLRWRKPQDPEPWDGILECDHFAPMSMQTTNLPIYDSLVRIIGYSDYKISLKDNYIPPVSEDSLYINVWKPAGEHENLPVLVYIHGGTLQSGQAWTKDYDGKSFAKNGIVTVNLGYRLGVFGYYTDMELMAEEGTAGNFGLLDQIKALEWVRDNIAAFGGDPNNVTIVGESAGSACIDALCVSPLAKGLFRRAVLESSTLSSVNPPHSYRDFETALKSGQSLKERYNCSTVEDLRKLDAKTIVGELSTQHYLTNDGYALLDSPYNTRMSGVHNEEALLHGYNLEESGPFIMFSHANMKNYENRVRAYFRDYADDVLAIYNPTTNKEADEYWAIIYGAVFFNYPHYCLNRLAVKEGIPVYEYLFSKSNGMLSSWHSGELIYVFKNLEGKKLFDEVDYKLSETMHSYWANFATNGDPNGEGLPTFPQNTNSAHLLELGDQVQVIDEPYLALYEVMDRMYGFEI